MKRLKTNEKFYFKSIKKGEEKPVFKNKNSVTIVRLVIGEEIEFNGEFIENKKHFDWKSESKVISFVPSADKIFVNTETETYVFDNIKK